MNTVQLIHKPNICSHYADSWDTIDPKHAEFVGQKLYELQHAGLSVDKFRIDILSRFLNVKGGIKPPKKMNELREVDYFGNLSQLSDTVNFFFKISKVKNDEGVEHEQYEVVPRLTVNLVKSIRTILGRHYGPGDFFGETTGLEFKDLLYCADKWMEEKDEYYLTRMLAIAYRPKRKFIRLMRLFNKFDGKYRIPYTANITDLRISLFEKVPLGIKYMFFYYIMGCMYILKTDNEGAGIEVDGHLCYFSFVFGGKDKTPEDDNDFNEGNEDRGIGLTGVLMALSENGVFGSYKQTSETDIWDILTRIYQLDLQRREMERNMKKK